MENIVQILIAKKKVKEDKVVTLHDMIACKYQTIYDLNFIIQEEWDVTEAMNLENETLNSTLSEAIQQVMFVVATIYPHYILTILGKI
jgi:regulator of replication initiation timing